MMNRLRFFLLLCCAALPAWAVTIEQPLADPAQERAAQAIFRELKCVVCEGQALAESDATLARQMRAEIRRMVADGTSTSAVMEYFTARYGQEVLLTPPVARTTLLLWLAPALLLALGVYLITRSMR